MTGGHQHAFQARHQNGCLIGQPRRTRHDVRIVAVVAPRSRFIQTHAKQVRKLDV